MFRTASLAAPARLFVATALLGAVACKPAETSPPTPLPDDEEIDARVSDPPRRNGGNAGSGATGGGSGGSAGQGSAGTGGSMDGGSPDAPSDAASDVRPTSDASSTKSDAPPPLVTGGPVAPCKYQLCESFEDYADGAQPGAPWARQGGRTAVSSDRAVRGTKSLKIVTGATAGEFFIRQTKTFPLTNGSVYGRAYFWIDKRPDRMNTAGVVHWTLLEASSSATGGAWVARLGGIYNKFTNKDPLFFNIESHMPPKSETGLSDSPHVPSASWQCVEFHYDVPKQEAEFWWNGAERPRLHWLNNKPEEPKFQFRELKSLSFGWATYQAAEIPYEVYIDEIAVHTSRIGCE